MRKIKNKKEFLELADGTLVVVKYCDLYAIAEIRYCSEGTIQDWEADGCNEQDANEDNLYYIDGKVQCIEMAFIEDPDGFGIYYGNYGEIEYTNIIYVPESVNDIKVMLDKNWLDRFR